MKRIGFSILALIVILLTASVGVEAKWWIFGKSESDVGVDYLYLNNVAFDEKDTEITLYKESLPNGNIIIRGKGLSGSAQTGAAQVSLDGKENWEKAKLSDDGTFEYVFKPVVGKTYDIYVKTIDTTGKTNDIDATHKLVTVSPESVSNAVIEVLDNLIDSYETEDPRRFMTYISQDFAGDSIILERAIRKDFTVFDNIDLRFSINSIAAGAGGNIYVSILFNRLLTSTKSGETLSDKGSTEFVFRAEQDGLKVYSMKIPLIFGLSEASEVATGVVINATNDQIIVVGQNGDVQKLAFPQAVDVIQNGGIVGSSTKPVITSITGHKHHYITLHMDLKIADPSNYDISIEEAFSPGGPWENVYGGLATSSIQLSTQTIASEATILYYRVQLEDMSNYQRGEWSDPAAWDNR